MSQRARIAALAVFGAVVIAVFAYAVMGRQAISLLIFLPAGLLAVLGVYALFFAKNRALEWWSVQTKPVKGLVLCAAIASPWLLFFFNGARTLDHALEAAIWVLVVLLFWGAYLIFSRIMDSLWARIRGN